MSVKAIQIGPYTNKRKRENMKIIEKLNKKKFFIFPQLRFSDADDILTSAMSNVSSFLKIDWSAEVKDLDKSLQIAENSIANVHIPSQDYMDILAVTGTEADNRRDFLEFTETVSSIWFKNLLVFTKSLPGMRELNMRDFLSIAVKHFNISFILEELFHICIWDQNFLYYKLNDRILKIEKKSLERILDQNSVNVFNAMQLNLKKINLTREEAVFLYSLQLISGNEKPHFKETYNRTLVSFIRYLKGNYENYEKRLLELTNFLANFEINILQDKRWSQQHQKYLRHFFKKPLCQLFFYAVEIGECIDELSNLEF